MRGGFWLGFLSSIFDEFIVLESLIGGTTLSFLRRALYIPVVPASAFLGFYIIRLVGHIIWRSSIPNVSRRQTVAAVILLFIVVILPIGLKGYYRSMYQSRYQKLMQETSITNFAEEAFPRERIEDKKLEISADIFVPLEGDYMISAYLKDLSNYRTVLPIHQISLSVNSQAIYKKKDSNIYVHLSTGTQKITLLVEFSEFFDDQRSALKEAITSNSLILEVNIYTTNNKGEHWDKQLFRGTYRISGASIDKLDLTRLLDEYR